MDVQPEPAGRRQRHPHAKEVRRAQPAPIFVTAVHTERNCKVFMAIAFSIINGTLAERASTYTYFAERSAMCIDDSHPSPRRLSDQRAMRRDAV
jgi:hypothetical protein